MYSLGRRVRRDHEIKVASAKSFPVSVISPWPVLIFRSNLSVEMYWLRKS